MSKTRRRLLWLLFVIEPALELAVYCSRWWWHAYPDEHWWQGLWAWLIYGHKYGTEGEWVPAIR